MHRISHLVVVAALACGAQAAWSDEASQAAEQNAENLTVAQIAGAEHREMAAGEAKRMHRNVLEELGLATDGPFPSKGGPIDE